MQAGIVIDAHMVGEQEGGNETYILNLIRGLQTTHGTERFWIATAHPKQLEERISLGGRFLPVTVSANPFRRLLVDLPNIVKEKCARLLHVTYFAPLWLGIPYVATIHDIIYALHPDWFSFRDRMILKTGISRSMKAAAAIITLSESSKRDILKHFPVHESLIHSIHLASDEMFFKSPASGAVEGFLKKADIKRPYILAVSSLHPRKNIRRLIEAFGMAIKHRGLSHHLVVAGKAHWKESEITAAVRQFGLASRITFAGYVSDSDLPLLYRGADAFVYPSLYEGFGIPVLEAMACGVPVICSNTSSLPEAAGKAAAMFDPEDTHSLSKALIDVLGNQAEASRLRALGIQHARSFSWSKTAAETLSVYRKVLGVG